MKTEKPLFNRWLIISVYTFLVILMVVGSFFDYPISLALYNESNKFGIFLAAYGEYPATLGFVVSGALLIIGRNRDKKATQIIQIILGIILIILGTIEASLLPNLYLTISPIIILLIGVLCSAITVILTIYISKKAERKEIIKVAMVIVFSILAEMIIINIIKIPWGRARMRLVAKDSRAYFMPWWQIDSSLKDELVSVGVAKEEFKSFPSGHVGNAIIILLLGLIPRLDERLKGKEFIFLLVGAIWTILVMLSRIIMGAHYLTDTVVACVIGFSSILIVYSLIYKKKLMKE